jgi:hypothetical protein
MIESSDLYRARVAGLLALADYQHLPAVAASLLSAEVVLLPSFHAETSITVTMLPDETVLRFATMNSSIWYHKNNEPLPKLQTEVVRLSDALSKQFWPVLEDPKPPAPSADRSFALDGMAVLGRFRNGSSEHCFEHGSPDDDSSYGRFAKSLYELAWSALNKDWAIERLEQLQGYFGLGFPARFIDGPIERLRLFGSLHIGYIPHLKELFSQIEAQRPLILDMTNGGGMGTALYPMFIEFDGSHPNIAWAAAPGVKRQLLEMNLKFVFGNLEEAEWSIRERTSVRKAT